MAITKEVLDELLKDYAAPKNQDHKLPTNKVVIHASKTCA